MKELTVVQEQFIGSAAAKQWFWYVARSNEIFIDADKEKFHKGLDHVRRRLQGAIEADKLKVNQVIQLPSATNGHRHIIIQLSQNIGAIDRAVWAIIFHSDIYRACATIARITNGVAAADVLISPHDLSYNAEGKKLGNIVRNPDDFCYCEAKHKAAVMDKCPAAIRLRGENRTRGFFGKPSDNKCRFL